jgi:hypothetical protein
MAWLGVAKPIYEGAVLLEAFHNFRADLSTMVK